MARLNQIVGTLAVAAALIVHSVPASAQTSAPLTFCNKTSEVAGVADGYFSPGVKKPTDVADVLTGPLVSDGWWSVHPGECVTLANPFNARYMFWFAYTISYHQTPPEDPAKTHFCINDASPPKLFTFEEENASREACSAAGNTWWMTANRVDTWINATVDFTGQ